MSIVAQFINTMNARATETLERQPDSLVQIEELLGGTSILLRQLWGSMVSHPRKRIAHLLLNAAFDSVATAAMLASAGKISSFPAQFRLGLEAVGYAAHVLSSEEKASAYLARHSAFEAEIERRHADGSKVDMSLFFQATRESRFMIGDWMESLEQLLGEEIARQLGVSQAYEASISFGAHPNIAWLKAQVVGHENDETQGIAVAYNFFTADPEVIDGWLGQAEWLSRLVFLAVVCAVSDGSPSENECRVLALAYLSEPIGNRPPIDAVAAMIMASLATPA